MRPIAPRIAGLEEEHIDGDEYRVLPAARGETDVGGPCIISRWRLSAEERDRIIAGEDVFLVVVGARTPPVQLHVGWPYGDLES